MQARLVAWSLAIAVCTLAAPDGARSLAGTTWRTRARQQGLRLIGALEQAWEAGDAHGVGRLFLTNATLVLWTGLRTQGRDEIVRRYQAISPNYTRDMDARFRPVMTHEVERDLIIVECDFGLFRRNGAPVPGSHGPMIMVVRMTRAGPRIAALQFTRYIRPDEDPYFNSADIPRTPN